MRGVLGTLIVIIAEQAPTWLGLGWCVQMYGGGQRKSLSLQWNLSLFTKEVKTNAAGQKVMTTKTILDSVGKCLPPPPYLYTSKWVSCMDCSPARACGHLLYLLLLLCIDGRHSAPPEEGGGGYQ